MVMSSNLSNSISPIEDKDKCYHEIPDMGSQDEVIPSNCIRVIEDDQDIKLPTTRYPSTKRLHGAVNRVGLTSQHDPGVQVRYMNMTEFVFWLIILLCWSIPGLEAKGTAVMGAAGGSSDGVCTECAGNYTAEEMKVAVIILSIILLFFFGILCCQCYNRFYYEFVTKHEFYADTKGMPPPPYIRRDYLMKNEMKNELKNACFMA